MRLVKHQHVVPSDCQIQAKQGSSPSQRIPLVGHSFQNKPKEGTQCEYPVQEGCLVRLTDSVEHITVLSERPNGDIELVLGEGAAVASEEWWARSSQEARQHNYIFDQSEVHNHKSYN